MSTDPLSFLSAFNGGSNGGDDFSDFNDVTPSGGFGPIPKGTYLMVAVAGKMTPSAASSNGSAYYTVTFKVYEGEYKGRQVWNTLWWTPKAKEFTKEKLQELKLTTVAQIYGPFPGGRMLFKVNVTVRKGDDGTEYNEVKWFKYVRDIEPEVDPYAPEQPKGGSQ